MKKITFIIILLISSLGFSQQELIENFETSSNYTFAGFEGLGSATIATDPAVGGAKLNGLRLVSASTGNAWQGAEVVLLNSKIKLTTDKTVKIDVYATQAFTMLAKVETGGAASATSQAYTTPNSWQTLTFTFTNGLDGTATANGEYSKIVFFPNWNGNFATPATNFTIHVDNITAEKTAVIPPSNHVLIENFETSSNYTFAGFEGLGSATIATDPAVGGANLNGLRLVSASTGNGWQGAEVVLLNSKIKLTTDKTVKIDVYSTQAFTMLCQVENGGATSASSGSYTTPNSWQTLTFNFAVPRNNTAAANGEYAKIVFFPNWKADNTGFVIPPANFTVNVDNITAEKTVVIPPSNHVLIENFETSSNYTFAGFEGLGSATIATDPAVGGAKLNGLRLVSASTGNAWQGAEVVLLNCKIKLTTDKTVKIDVYSTQAFTMLCQVENGGATSASSGSYTTPNSWQTLTFNFAVPRNNTAAANGEYAKIVFFPNWKADNTGFGTPANFAVHVDNVFGEKVVTTPAFQPTAAPTPSTPPTQVFSIYSDTGGFTNIWTKDYAFGSFASKLDLDTTTSVNEAIKMNFATAGYGEGLDPALPRKDVSAYGYLNFNYYVESGAANAGSLGHQFYFDLISRIGATNTEAFYGIGTALTTAGTPSEHVKKVIVFDSWQTVSIPLSDFVGFSPADFFQFKIGSSSDLRTKIAFFDNIYFSVNSTLGNEKFETSIVKMYPNPTSNVLNIESVGTIQNIAIYNVLGQEVMNKLSNETSVSLDVSGLNSGIYVIKTKIDGLVSSSKFIKE